MAEKLNILCSNPKGGAFLYITRGWGNAFKALGHNFLHWDGSEQQLKQFKPHIYLGCSGWRQDIPKWVRDEFGTKIAIHVNAWGSTQLKSLPGETNVNESETAIKWTIGQQPDFLYCYAIEQDIKHIWNKWEDKVGPVVAMPTAGDAVIHKPVMKDHRFTCQLGFIGGRWKYKALNIDKYLVPAINEHDSKIYGWGGWKNNSKYQGPINDDDVNKLFSSAKVCPSIVEPHTSRYGIDIPERMFKIPLAGGFTILDPCEGIERYISSDIFPIAKNPNDYRKLITYYINHDEERERLQKQQNLVTLQNHTYFSRIQGFLRFSGYEAEAEEAQEKVNGLINDLV
jgi:hypothetical protein